MDNISVVILTKNEEKNILDCLERVGDAAEIIIVDDNSIDRTHEIIKLQKKYNIKFFSHDLDGDFSQQRNFGLSKAKNEWVMFVDVDERISKSLLDEIENVIISTSKNGFYIKRADVIWGRDLQHGETGNIKLLRLARKNSGSWSGKVHEVWKVNGETGVLSNRIIHHPHQTIKDFIAEINFYTTLRAQELYSKKTSVSALDVLIYPKAKFFLNYIIKLGFMDGIPGLLVASLMSFHSFLVRGKLWLLWHKSA